MTNDEILNVLKSYPLDALYSAMAQRQYAILRMKAHNCNYEESEAGWLEDLLTMMREPATRQRGKE